MALVLLPGLFGLIADGVDDPQALLADPEIPQDLRIEAMHRLGIPETVMIDPHPSGGVTLGMADVCQDVDPVTMPATHRACARLALRDALSSIEGTPMDGLLDTANAQITCGSGVCEAQVAPLPAYYQSILRRSIVTPEGPKPVMEAPEAHAVTTTPSQRVAPSPVDVIVPTVIVPSMFAAGIALMPWHAWGPSILRVLRRVAFAVPLLGLYSRVKDDDLLENETRKGIHSTLEENPGTTIQELRERLDIAWGTTVYHLEKLERAGILVSQRHGNHRRYFVAGTKEARTRKGFTVLQTHTARRLAQAVMTNPGANQSELCDQVGIRPPVASKYLKRLEEHSLVRAEQNNRFKHYQPTSLLRDLPDTAWD